VKRLDVAGALREALRIGMAHDERHLIVRTAPPPGGTWSDELARELGPARVLTLPTGPDAAVGVALGLSAGGLRPIVELRGTEDAERALRQLAQAGRARQRGQGRLNAKLTLRAPLADGVEALYARCPGLRVVVPSSPAQAKALFLGALRCPDPVAFLEPAGAGEMEDVPDGGEPLAVGTASLCHGELAGADAVALAFGRAVGLARAAADVLAAQGVRLAVLDLRSLQPLDEDAVRAAASAAGRCVVVSDGPLAYGVASELVALVERTAFAALRAPVACVGLPDVPHPAAPLEAYYRPRVEAVLDAVRTVMGTGAGLARANRTA
jgi:pyruvate dehydrogenase E1 component beta subunit